MTTAAYIGSQTLLQVGDGASPETFVTIGEVVSISAIARKKDLVEVTHLLSTAKEFIGGLPDGQEVSVVCNHVPTNVQQLMLWTASRTPSPAMHFQYVFPDTAAGAPYTSSFSAIVLSSSLGPTTPNTGVQTTFGLKITGPIIPFGDEYMPSIVTDISDLVVFPQPEVTYTGGPENIMMQKTGQILTLTLNFLCTITAPIPNVQMNLPPEFQSTATPQLAASANYQHFPTASPNPTAQVVAATIYVNQGAGYVQLFPDDFATFPGSPDSYYFVGQITYAGAY